LRGNNKPYLLHFCMVRNMARNDQVANMDGVKGAEV
jgi:hypothetical protein